MDIRPFTVHFPDATLDDLRERLTRTRWPGERSGSGWDYGTNLAYLKELVEYWRTRFEWRAQETAINSFPNFRATIDGLGIHFIHERGKGPNPLPIVVTHGWPDSIAFQLKLSPKPPMDRDGRREDSGRGEGVTGAMIRARIWVDGRLAGGLQALFGAPMAAYSGCGERDGGIGHGKRRWRTGLARDCGDVGLAGGSVADGRRQAGSGMARSRARARLNCSSQGQRRGRCRVNRRAERVIRPAKGKTRRLRVLVVTIC